jgi:hypothetical protein
MPPVGVPVGWPLWKVTEGPQLAELRTKLSCDSCPGEFCYLLNTGTSRCQGDQFRDRPTAVFDECEDTAKSQSFRFSLDDGEEVELVNRLGVLPLLVRAKRTLEWSLGTV